MNKQQTLVISLAAILFLFLYFGVDRKPREQATIDKARALAAESTNVAVLLKEAKEKMPPAQKNMIASLEQLVQTSESDSTKISYLKQLAGKWYEFKNPAISGHYAEQIAEMTNTPEAWSIGGTTYTIALQQSKEEKIKSYCAQRAVKAYENAISLQPDNLDHQVNLALVNADYPPKENPMKGILMLLDLNKANPENVSVLYNLGRLGLKTGQFEKASQRLEKAISIDPENLRANCLIAEAYAGLGNMEKKAAAEKRCQELSKQN